MCRIDNRRLVKGDGIFKVSAWFNAPGYLPDVFISESEEVVIYVFHDSETSISQLDVVYWMYTMHIIHVRESNAISLLIQSFYRSVI